MRTTNQPSQPEKKIVLYLSTFPQLSETFIVNKFIGLINRGWDVHILCNHLNKKSWALFPSLLANSEAKHRVHQTCPVRPLWLIPFLFPLSLIICLVRSPRLTWRYLKYGWKNFNFDVFRRFYLDATLLYLRPDILHFEFGSLAVNRTYLKNFLGVKFSCSFRGYDINYIGLDQPEYYRNVWETLDGVHFLGKDLWLRAQRRGAPQETPYTLIPPSIDLSIFPLRNSYNTGKLGSPQHPLRIISVGRLHWKKGYEFSLEAIRKLIDLGICCNYKIIGTGKYQEALYFERHQLNLEGYVTFFGMIPHQQVIKHLCEADVFLHGAVSEGFCNAVLEAQAMSLPVVCTDADGLTENIKDSITGFVVPRRNPKAIAEKLALLANEGQLRRKMGIAGRSRVGNYFQMNQQISGFEGFYAEL